MCWLHGAFGGDSHLSDLNREPRDYKSRALPVELRWHWHGSDMASCHVLHVTNSHKIRQHQNIRKNHSRSRCLRVELFALWHFYRSRRVRVEAPPTCLRNCEFCSRRFSKLSPLVIVQVHDGDFIFWGPFLRPHDSSVLPAGHRISNCSISLSARLRKTPAPGVSSVRCVRGCSASMGRPNAGSKGIRARHGRSRVV